MMPLKGAAFLMGEQGSLASADEAPVHRVEIAPFALGRFEVTFDEWGACVADGACRRDVSDEGWGRGTRPVINVSWIEIHSYLDWLTRKTGHRYRLASEAEWEYAARAGTATRYSWGDNYEWSCRFANTFDATSAREHPNWQWQATCTDGYVATAPVGSFPPNPWGFHDLNGNVWEWVEDCWHPDYTAAPADGSAWIDGGDCRKRINRGGGWSNHPRSMRSSSRDADDPHSRSNALGFRVARDP